MSDDGRSDETGAHREHVRSMLTTLYLISAPANARRLDESIERSERGEYEVHELDRS